MDSYRRTGALIASLAVLSLASACDKKDSKPPETGCTIVSGGVGTASGVPLPPACASAKPAGAVGGLHVLDWAGFKAAVSYTFDDGVDSQIANYETLKAPGVPMTFYLNTRTATALTPEVRAAAFQRWLADGNELGNHTAYHCHMSAAGALEGDCAWSPGNVPVAGTTPQSEIAEVTSYIEDTLHQPGIWTMASPYGDADWDAFAAEAHFLVHRDVWQGMLSPNDLTNQYHLPVYMVGAVQYGGLSGDEAVIEQVAVDARDQGKWALILVHQVGPATDSIGCCEVPAATIAASMRHLKALGNVWGDTVVNVASYWVGQKLLSTATPVVAGATTTWSWELPANFPPGKYLRVGVTGGTLKQHGTALPWNDRGFYEVALDAGELTLEP